LADEKIVTRALERTLASGGPGAGEHRRAGADLSAMPEAGGGIYRCPHQEAVRVTGQLWAIDVDKATDQLLFHKGLRLNSISCGTWTADTPYHPKAALDCRGAWQFNPLLMKTGVHAVSLATERPANSATKPSLAVRHDAHAPHPCKLCGQARELVNSHIIPKFCHATMYPPKPGLHRFHYMHDVDAGEVKWEQDGFKEYLLCKQCDNEKLGAWEEHATRLFKTQLPQPAPGQAQPILFHDPDYSRLKLFFLSVLWRAGVSTHEFYEHVRLGPHEEKIRKMLLQSIPGDPRDYGCAVSLLLDRGQPLRSVLVQPTPCGVQDPEHDRYIFVFGGFLLLYFISTQGLTPKLQQSMLKTDGSLTIEQIEHDDFPVLRDLRKRAAGSVRGVP
jgi:hypothetical protein